MIIVIAARDLSRALREMLTEIENDPELSRPVRAWCMDQGCRRIDPNPVWG